MSPTFDLFRLFRSPKNKKNNLSSSKRSLHIESLEDRALLAVTLGDYQAIANAYPDLGLNPNAFTAETWETQTTINVMEVGGEDATDNMKYFDFDAAGLKKAIDAASASDKPDLIVVRTSADQNTIALGGSEIAFGGVVGANQSDLKIKGGAITVVGWNVAASEENVADNAHYSLTLDAGGTSRVMSIREGADIRLANMTIANGNASGDGGGIYFHSHRDVKNGATSSVILSGVTFENNKASGNGGGFFQSRYINEVSSKFYNVLFTGNTAGTNGGGIAISGAGNTGNSSLLVNCTVVGNKSPGGSTTTHGGAGIYAAQASKVTVTNSVFWGNTHTANGANQDRKDIFLADDNKSISYSLWDKGTTQGVDGTNLTGISDPGFVDSANGNYSLSPSSPLINRGNNAVIAANSFDLAGNPRVYGNTVDIGAFEIQQDQYIAMDDGSAETPVIIDLKTTSSEKITIPEGNGNWSGLEVQAFELGILENDVFTSGTNPHIEIVNNIDGNSMSDGLVFIANGKVYYAWGFGINDVYSFSYKIGAAPGSAMSNEATVTFKVAYDGPILISTLQDETDYDLTDGDLSLREALVLADKLGVSTIGIAEGLIDLTDTTPGANTIVLSHADDFGAIVLDSDMTIDARGLVIDAGNESQIFVIRGSSIDTPVNVTLIGMTLDNGFADEQDGGAIYALMADLTLTDMTIQNSAAGSGGGLYADRSSVTMSGGAFKNNTAEDEGGAFANYGYTNDVLTYSFDGVVFDGNAASFGGAVNVRIGELEITNSQFFHNNAEKNGGAVSYSGDKLDISYSIFAQNMADWDGGALQIGSAAVATILNTTIVNNTAGEDGGGISYGSYDDDALMQLDNSIVALNTGTRGSDIYNGAFGLGLKVTGTNNIIGMGHWGDYNLDFGLVHGENGNLIGTASNPLDPKLDGNYAPTQFSLAVDHGNDELVSDEQIKGNHIDIGAVESAFTANEILFVNTEVDGSAVADKMSLREAVSLAKASGEHYFIMFDNSMRNKEIVLATLQGQTASSTAQLLLSTDITIIGLGSDLLTISAAEGHRIFYITGDNVSISGMTLADVDYADKKGGAIHTSSDNLELTSMLFANNSAGRGAGVYQVAGHTKLEDVTFTGNSADYYGGAFYLYNGTADMYNTTFSGNTAVNGGGAVSVGSLLSDAPVLNVYDSVFSGNQSLTGKAGAIYGTNDAQITVNASEFSRNEALQGGAIYLAGTTQVTIGGPSTFSGNKADRGGAIYQAKGTLTISSAEFSGNEALHSGGAVYQLNGIAKLNNVNFLNRNYAGEHGGAISTGSQGSTSAVMEITTARFEGNESGRYGGAIYMSSNSTLDVIGASFSGNTTRARYGSAIAKVYEAGKLSYKATSDAEVKIVDAGLKSYLDENNPFFD